MTPNVALFTEYKFTDAKFGFNGAFGSFGGFDSTYRAHQLFAGVSLPFLMEGAHGDSMDGNRDRWMFIIDPDDLRRVAASDPTDGHA